MSRIKLSNFLHLAGPVIARRGTEYWNNGCVELQEADGSRYLATVHGSRDYTTEVVLDGDDVVSHNCNCPYSGTLCKHEVALLLAVKDKLSSGTELFPAPAEETKPAPKTPDKPVFTINGISITERELFLLCLLAVGGNNALSKLSYIPVSVGRDFKMTAAERNSILARLVASGLIEENRYWNGKSYELNVEFCYPLLKELVSNHDSWLQFFRSSIRIDRREQYLLEVAEVCLGKRSIVEHEWPYYEFDQSNNY